MTDNTQEMIRNILQAQIVQALQSTPDAIADLVRAALSKQVDSETGSYESRGWHSSKVEYLDYICGQAVRNAAERAVHELVDERYEAIKAAVREKLPSEAVAESFLAAVTDSVKNRSWALEVKFVKKERD